MVHSQARATDPRGLYETHPTPSSKAKMEMELIMWPRGRMLAWLREATPQVPSRVRLGFGGGLGDRHFPQEVDQPVGKALGMRGEGTGVTQALLSGQARLAPTPDPARCLNLSRAGIIGGYYHAWISQSDFLSHNRVRITERFLTMLVVRFYFLNLQV